MGTYFFLSRPWVLHKYTRTVNIYETNLKSSEKKQVCVEIDHIIIFFFKF